MDEDCDFSEDFDCPSLLCEEQEALETRNDPDRRMDRKRKEEVEAEEMFNRINGEEAADKQEENSEKKWEEKEKVVAEYKLLTTKRDEKQVRSGMRTEQPQEGQTRNNDMSNESVTDKTQDKETNSLEEREDQKKVRRRRGKKQVELARGKRRFKGFSDKVETEKTAQTQEVSATSPAHSSAMSETTAELMDRCDLSKPIYLGCGSSGLYCPPAPTPLLYSSHPPVPIQPAPPQLQGTKSPNSPYLSHSLPQPNLQPLEMEISEVYSTRRSIRYSTRGRGRTLGFPLMPGLENIDNCLLQPAPKKKTRTLYSTDQLEHLEALFHEDHYPDGEKRKAIAASVGVTPQRIMVWFQNRRAKWRKAEKSIPAKTEHRPSSSPQHNQIKPVLPSLAQNKPSSFSGHFTTKLPQIAPSAPSFPTSSYSNLSASPGQLRVREEDQHQFSSQGGLAVYQPRPMHSPPPIRRASLPLFTTSYNPANPNPPLLNTLDHTPPLFLDALEAGSSLAHNDIQPLQTDTSSLFDFGEKLDYLTSSQQNNLMYQLQTSYPSSQPQHQPQAPLPLMSYHTLSPYLTPNPPDSNPTSYLTFGPGGSSTGVVTYSTGSHTYFQPQSTGQVLLPSTGHHGGITAYQSYPWGNMYSQPTIHQRPQCPPSYPSSLVNARDHQLASSSTLPTSLFFTRDGPSHTNPQHPSHSQSHTSSSTTTTVLPPVSTLRPSRLKAETTPTMTATQLPSQVSPASPGSSPVTPCVKIEYDSPREIHSHFHCDFSPIHF